MWSSWGRVEEVGFGVRGARGGLEPPGPRLASRFSWRCVESQPSDIMKQFSALQVAVS